MTQIHGEIKTRRDSDHHGRTFQFVAIERAIELGGFIVQSPDPARVDQLILDEEVQNLFIYSREVRS